MNLLALNGLLCVYGVNGTARRLGVSARTVRRWRDRQTAPAGYLARLIELEHSFWLGELSALGQPAQQWAGWRITADGLLRAPSGAAFTPGDLLAFDFLRLNRALGY